MTVSAPTEPPTAWRPPTPDGEPRRVALPTMLANVLESLCECKTNAEIGADWGISEDTVKTHMRRLFRALDARDRVHAVTLVWSGVVEIIRKPPSARWSGGPPVAARTPTPATSTSVGDRL